MEVEYSIDFDGINIQLYQARLDRTRTEAVVLPANPNLLQFEGVAKRISVLAGLRLKEEIQFRFPRPLPLGEAVVTHAYNMIHKYIFHCVIPHYTTGICSKNVRMAMVESIRLVLSLCQELDVRSFSMPLLGNDCRQVPIKLFAESLGEALQQFLAECREIRVLSFIHIVDTDIDSLEKLKNLMSAIFKFRVLREPASERPNFTITPIRKLSPTSSAAIIVVSRSQFDLIRERVMRVSSNEYKIRSVGGSSLFLTDLRPRIPRLIRDVVYVKAPRNMQTLHVFKRILFTELKVLLACGRRYISMVVEKDALFMENTNFQILTAENIGSMLEEGMEMLL